MMQQRTLVMIMAGGKGSRLGPLTCHRSKPAMPFGGRYRIIDFVLSNFVNAGYRRIHVLTQYMASSLIQHLSRNWQMAGFGDYIEVVPAQMRVGEVWYRGTADAVYQNLNLVRDSRAEHVAVFGGDHIYKFDITQMESMHQNHGADVTVAAFPVPREEGNQFGILAVDENGRMTDFVEKPSNPPPIPGRPDWCLASMGNYFFRSDLLEEALIDDSEDPSSRHDFGHNILPRMLAQGAKMMVYDFGGNALAGEPGGAAPYWRDVGTIESYFRANMDLRAEQPELNMYNRAWRIRTAQRDFPPARFVRADGRPCTVDDSLICEGSVVAGSTLREVLGGYDCMIQAGSELEYSVLLSGCEIGAGSRLRRVLMDKNCKIAPGVTIGYDPVADRERFPFISDSGIVVLPKGTHVPAEGPIQFAYDIEFLLRQSDASTSKDMERMEGKYTVSESNRHSYVSAGPRHRLVGRPSADMLSSAYSTEESS